MFRTNLIFLGLCMLFSSFAYAQDHSQAIELGKVDWLRDFDKAIAQSKKTGKPVFILFQEVPRL